MCVDKDIILTFADTVDLSVGTGFFISAAGEHCNRLLLVFLFTSKVVGYDTSQLSVVSQTAQERSCSSVEVSCLGFPVRAETACYHLLRFLQECNSGMIAVELVNLAIIIASVDEWQLQS
jgi:hypothetical protein